LRAVGIIAAAAFYFFYPPVYESQAKLLVRYVLERSAVDSIDSANARPADVASSNDRVIGAEIQILTSWDLAVQVADSIGAKRLGTPSKEAAAGSIFIGVAGHFAQRKHIIFVSYKNRDPQIATLVLQNC